MDDFTPDQIAELKKYSDNYATIQLMAKKFYFIKSTFEIFPEKTTQEKFTEPLRKYALTLRQAIQDYQKNTPDQIQQIFTWGRSLSSLESLATNHLASAEVPKQ